MTKKILKVLGCVLLVGIIFVVGSGCLQGFWLVRQPSPAAVLYGNEDPNKYALPLVFLGDVQRLKQQIEIAHIVTQIDLEALTKKDRGIHTLVKNEVGLIATEGEEQYGTWIGSVKEPGVLWSVLMMGAGGGGAAAILRKIWYTETEHQADVEKARNNN